MLVTQFLLFLTPFYRISCTAISVIMHSDNIYMVNTYTTQPSDEKPFSCTECDFKYNKYSIHILEHTGEHLITSTKFEYIYTHSRIILPMYLRKIYFFNV